MSPQRSGRRPLAIRILRTRWLVRAPIWLYRARLGFLFGNRLLMLEHVGRRYAARHPGAWKRLAPVLAQTLEATLDNSGATVPMVALELTR